jgi:hypothetical protein
MKSRELREAIDVYNELLRVHQLNIEILESLELTLHEIRQFCESHNIPFGNAKMGEQLSKINGLLDEIEIHEGFYLPPNGNLQRGKPNKEFTESR